MIGFFSADRGQRSSQLATGGWAPCHLELTGWSPALLLGSILIAGGCECSEEEIEIRDPEPTAWTEVGPPPDVKLRVSGEEEWALVIENHDPEPVELEGEVWIERENGERWSRFGPGRFVLSCEGEAPLCAPLVPGAALHPPAWPAWQSANQCACPNCEPARNGRYRFVVRTCGGDHQFESEPFDVGQPTQD